MLVYVIIGIIAVVTILTVIEHKIKYSDEEEELSEKDKTMKALRSLIYIIIFLIVGGVVIKLFFWGAILSI